MIKITKQMILNLVGLLDKHGLVHGAGNTKQQFCIQQAVNRVIHNDLYGQYSDHPDWDCLGDGIRAFGVRMNDCSNDRLSNKERAEALKRFAIAELGSHEIDGHIFFDKLREKLGLDGSSYGEDIVDDYMHGSHDQDHLDWSGKLKHLADTSASILEEMGTEGSKFLYILDEPDKWDRINKAYDLGDKMYAAQMADFGCNVSCGMKPKQHKH